MDHLSRRSFLAAAGVAAATSSSLAQLGAARANQRDEDDDLRKSGRAPFRNLLSRNLLSRNFESRG